jgi:predicted NAD/FAD-dependent oxidoreductase
VVHAEAEWSAARLERDPVEIEGELLAALEAATGEADLRPIAAQAHRWRFARSHGLGLGPLWDAATGLGVCGDWLTAPRVESAWLSGHGLARMVVEEPVRMAALAEPRSAWA